MERRIVSPRETASASTSLDVRADVENEPEKTRVAPAKRRRRSRSSDMSISPTPSDKDDSDGIISTYSPHFGGFTSHGGRSPTIYSYNLKDDQYTSSLNKLPPLGRTMNMMNMNSNININNNNNNKKSQPGKVDDMMSSTSTSIKLPPYNGHGVSQTNYSSRSPGHSSNR